MARQSLDQARGPDVTRVVLVPVHSNGRVLVSAPHGHPCKVSRPAGERIEDAAARWPGEEVVAAALSIHPIRGDRDAPQGKGAYFAVLITEQTDSVSSDGADLHWRTNAEARAALNASANATSGRRALGLLDSVGRMRLSPYRSGPLMVRELHLLGFERLRAICCIGEDGTWRCRVAPAAWVGSCGHPSFCSAPVRIANRVTSAVRSQSRLELSRAEGQAIADSLNGQWTSTIEVALVPSIA